MKQRLITGILLFLTIIPVVVFGGIWLNIFAGVVIALSANELLKVKEHKHWPFIIHLSVYAIIYYITFTNRDELLFDIRIYLAFVLLLFAFNVIFEQFDFEDVMYLFTMTFFLGIAFKSLYYVRFNLGIATFLFVVFATFGSDSGAYFIGIRYGKHKLNPRLSPKKSIEGSIGGVIIGTILAVSIGLFYDIKMSIFASIVIAIILTITSQFGDLTFSSLKRYYGIKDFSNLLPGHGGVLDRLDSISFNFLVFYLCLLFIM